MSTCRLPNQTLLWLAVCLSPPAIYAALRTTYSQKDKWYATFGYLLMYLMLGGFALEYIIIKADILIDSALHKNKTQELRLLEVRKVIKREIGFDHTAVRVRLSGKPVTLEARPYAFFYLGNKTVVKGKIGRSWLG
ncbi:hypothetical protein C7T94_07810 [Pedobacter yulinensis]|uniref:Uncharacterized protein n=1 Tax=Pedobacter yulinensis TaxID=2126353 RepID=A0A2T3HJD4_9SPHI|nr:hypothetical protein [Pedobacter yulinensis]PST82565.1 hypothetical protein C7T94_07810 [Pedobacter yulinensis]